MFFKKHPPHYYYIYVCLLNQSFKLTLLNDYSDSRRVLIDLLFDGSEIYIKLKKNIKEKLLTIKEIEGDSDFPYFNNEKERLRYMKDNYSDFTLSESFAKYLNLPLKDAKKLPQVSDIDVALIQIGRIVRVKVSRIEDGKVFVDSSGFKETFFVNDNLLSHETHFKHYLIDHDNEIDVMIKSIKGDDVICSIKDAYIRKWEEEVDDAIRTQKAVSVHIDKLFKSGYICSMLVHTLYEVFGVEKREQVFIPGSLIVVNIERDFNRWVGQDVLAIPQNVTTFKENSESRPVRSIVCSRKAALIQQSWVNLYNIFNRSKLADKFGDDSYGTFIGEISGKLHNNVKTGLFIELDNEYITGLYTCDEETYNKYEIGDKVTVKITEFEKKEGVKDEFTIRNNRIVKCNIRPILEITE